MLPKENPRSQTVSWLGLYKQACPSLTFLTLPNGLVMSEGTENKWLYRDRKAHAQQEEAGLALAGGDGWVAAGLALRGWCPQWSAQMESVKGTGVAKGSQSSKSFGGTDGAGIADPTQGLPPPTQGCAPASNDKDQTYS